MQVRNRILFFIVLFFFSCKPQKEVPNMITNGSYKYWLRPNDVDYKGRDLTFYYFDSEGKWLIFKKSLEGSFRVFEGGDVYWTPTWRLIKDSIQIGDNRFKIESIHDDTLSFCCYERTGKGITLIAAPSLIPIEYQKPQ